MWLELLVITLYLLGAVVMWSMASVDGVEGVDLWLVTVSWPIGAALLLLVSVACIVRTLHEGERGQ